MKNKNNTVWAALTLMLCGFWLVSQAKAQQALEFMWSDNIYSPYFSDINQDGINDLLLFSNQPLYFHQWILGEFNGERTYYPAANAEHFPFTLTITIP